MANTWQYGIFGQRERLDLIRKGNKSVYDNEKERNKKLKKYRSELGLSTTDVDDWEATIDNAYSNSKKQEKSTSLPTYSGKYAEVNKAFADAHKAIKEERDESLAAVEEEAKSTLEYLEEWLANNGYSADGKTASREKARLNDEAEKLMEEIKKQYRTDLDKARKSYFSSFLK